MGRGCIRPALLSGRRVRMGRGCIRPALPDQCAELRPLQNLRYQGPEPEHHLGHSGGRGRAELPEHVILSIVIAREGGRPSTRWPASSVVIAPSAFTGCPASRGMTAERFAVPAKLLPRAAF